VSDRSASLAWETEVVLRDGTAVRVRAARPQDEDALIAFYHGLSDPALVYRFFTRVSDAALAEQVRWLLYNPRVVSLLVTFGDPPRVVEGRPTVYLRDMSKAAAARAAVAGLLAGGKAGRVASARAVGPDDVQVRLGTYDVAQLLTWKHARREALGIPGVVFVDADERLNRVHVGIEPGTDATAVRRLAARLGVPQEAVIVSEVEPFKFTATWRDYVRPTAGGLQIAYFRAMSNIEEEVGNLVTH